MENFTGRPVVDETGLGGEYDWDLSYTHADGAFLRGSLRELGVELVPARRKIEMLVVTRPTADQ